MTISSGLVDVLKLLMVGALSLAPMSCASDDPGAAADSSSTSSPIEGVQTYPDLARDHTEDDVAYPQSPPVGGPHDPAWLDCNGQVYDVAVRDENAVHSLEHGAVWLTYQPDLPSSDIKVLMNKVQGQPYSFLSPYPGQSARVIATAWGVRLQLDSVDDPRLDEFFSLYRQGPQTPEPGAACTGGVMP